MKSNYKRLGEFISPQNYLNDGMEVSELLGISNQKYFQKSHTNINGMDFSTYRIVRTGQFAFNRATTRNGEKISIALRQGGDCIVSPSYRVFQVNNENELLSEYLLMWFKRPEFDRYVRFKSHGSAHEFFEYDQMCDVELPVPHIIKQREIVKEYNVIQNSITLNQQLIQKLEETAQAIYKEWFVEGIDIENLPEGWKVGSFEELIEISSGKSVSDKNDLKNDHYKYPIFGAGGIMGYSNEFSFNEKLFSIGRVGTHGIVQRINFPCWLSDNTLVLKSSSYEYVYQILLNINYDEINRGGVQGLITQTDIKNLQILIPENSILEKFEKTVLKLFELQNNVQNQNQKLTELKELLLSKLATIEN